jgi:hypothetical protein
MGIVMTKLTDPVINPVNYVSDLARPGEGVLFDLDQNLVPRKGVVSKTSLNILWGVGTMRNKRFQFGGRRKSEDMPRFPFKDSNGATIKECRRKIPGRRMNHIQGKWIDELVIP